MRFLTILLLITLAGAALPGRPHAVERLPDGTIKIRVQRLAYLSYAPLSLADSEGHFADAGIEIEWVALNRSADGVLPLVQGDLDVLPGIMFPGIFNLMGRGANMRMVADKGHVSEEGCHYIGFVARKELVESGRLKAPADLRGLRFGTSRTRPAYYDLTLLMASAGLTDDDVELVNVPTHIAPQALTQGTVDVVLIAEPELTQMVESGAGVLWLPLQTFVPGKQHSYLMFGPTLLEKDRDAGSAFMLAYRKALIQYNEGKTEANIKALARATSLDPDLVARLCWSPTRASGRMNLDDVTRYQQWAVDQGLLDKAVPVDSFWDGSFLDHTDSVLAGESGAPTSTRER